MSHHPLQRRRRGRQNLGTGAMTWLACARCGMDVWAPEDMTATCDRCTLRQAVRALAKESEDVENLRGTSSSSSRSRGV